MQDHKGPVQPNELKQFLSHKVSPILEGTSLDRSTDTKPMRRMLGQLVRDAAFSAHVLKANPDGKFVRRLVDCITQDSTRMRFLHQMSPAQASKTIEYLAKVGVRDPQVYPPLVAKLDFHNLKEIARVTFALAEAQLDDVNVNLVVPLYCGERWNLTYEAPRGAPDKVANSACNVFEAVRVLRAVSKSTRAVVEKTRFQQERQRRQPSHRSSSPEEALPASPIPVQSIRQLRDALLCFLFANEQVMRGAHWINTARALVHFPEETQAVGSGLLEERNASTGRALIDEVRDAAYALPVSRTQVNRGVVGGDVTCNDVALLCLEKVFDVAEGRRPADSLPGGSGPAFDLTQLDLVKLIPLLRQVPCSDEGRRQRFEQVSQVLMDNLSEMQFSGLVQLIHTLRQLEGSEAFTQDAVQRIAMEAGDRLAALGTEQSLREIPVARIVQFAAQLNAFRVRQCPGFATFLTNNASALPLLMNPDTAATFLSALTTVTGKGGAAVDRNVRQAVLVILANVVRYANSHYTLGTRPTAPLAQREFEDSLFFRNPLACTKILRALVLLDVLPTEDLVHAMLGARGDAHLNTALQQGGAVLIFDLSRSLTHFCRQARAARAEPSPRSMDATSPPKEMESLLWSRGVRHVLLPLLQQHTRQLAKGYTGAAGGRMLPSSSYVPVCWRSTLECAAPYVDVAMDVNKDLATTMGPRLMALHSACEAMARDMLGVLATQCTNLREASRTPSELHNSFSKLHFSSNAIVHSFSFMLVWEYLVFQAAWEANRLLGSTRNDVPAETRQLAEQLVGVRKQYEAFLEAPLGHYPRTDLQGLTAMQALGLAFSANPAASSPSAVSPSSSASDLVASEPILQKTDVLEITTHLPFAISLVMEPGPVNEFFSDKCVPIILESDQ